MISPCRAARGCTIAAVAAIIASAWPVAGRAQGAGAASFIVIDTAYAGRFQDDQLVRAVVDSLPAFVDTALGIIRSNLGMTPAISDSILVRIRDMPVTGTGKTYSASSVSYIRQGINDDGDRWFADTSKSYIRIYAENISVHGRSWTQQVLAHELVHGLMRSRLHTVMQRELPLWLIEGLAVYGSGMGHDKIDLLLCYQDSLPETLLNGIDNREHTGWDYGEDFLFLDRVAARYGRQAISGLFAGLLAGQGYNDALLRLTGVSWARLRPVIESDAMVWLHDYADDQYHRLQNGLADAKNKRYREAAAIFISAIDGPYRPRMLLEAGICYQQLQRYDSAITYYRQVMDCGGAFCDRALYRTAICCNRLALYDTAAALLETYLKSYPGGEDIDNIYYFLGQNYHNAKRYDLAAQRWETFLLNPQYATADAAANAAYQLGCCYYAMDNYDAARTWINVYLRKYPGHHRRAKAEQLLAQIELKAAGRPK